MGFAEENADVLGGGGGGFATGEQKQDLIDNGTPFVIIGAELRDNPFEDGEQYVVTIEVDDDEAEDGTAELKLTYTAGAVESRDKLCDRLAKWLDDPSNDGPVAKLTKVGRSQIIVILTDDGEELEKPEPKAKAAAKPAAKPKAAAKPAAKRTTAKRTTAKK